MFRKPRLRLFAGLGAATALVLALAFARGGDNGPAAKETPSAVATAPAWAEPPGAVSAAPAPAGPRPTPTPTLDRAETKVSTSTRTRPLPRAAPRRSSKPAKAVAARPSDDFGI